MSQTIVELSELIRARRISPVDVTSQLLERIARHDQNYHSFVAVTANIALDAARQAEAELQAGRHRGPLHGIPFGLKDIFDYAGVPTTAQSRVLQNNIPAEHAAVTARLLAAGGVHMGKLTTHEFAMGGPSFDLPWPPARNPWNADYFSGGSSSGSGVAVAAGFVPYALGTDTRGSIRNPASMCGIVGMKPTYGLISRRGVVPLSYSLDHVGPLTRTVADNAIVLNALAGHDVHDPSSAMRMPPDFTAGLGQGVAGMRIGVIRRFFEKDAFISAEMGRSLEELLRVYEKHGARLVDIDPGPLADYNAVTRIILIAEAFTVHENQLRQDPNRFGALMLERVMAGAFVSAADYINAQRNRSVLSRRFNATLAEVDVAVTASGMEPACKIDDAVACQRIYEAHARAPCNLTGNPALSMPTGFSREGMPLGIQLIGKPFAEATMYQVAKAYEDETRFFERMPPLLA
jgi:aspartyl-tRNA(Asn)/glutamyl-tRNA(Gln) amidotransferase subunit A